MKMVYAMKIWKRIILAMVCALVLAFPLLVYAENDATNGSSDAEQTTTTRGAVGDAVEAEPADDGTTIPEEETPLSRRSFEPGWALVNLLASLLTIIIGVTLVTYSMLSRSKGEQSGSDGQQPPNNFGLAVFGMFAAVISTILFTSTEDLSSRMIVVDSFTVVHIAVLAVSILCAVLSVKREAENPADLGK
jgi:hypothetical protein